MKPLTSMLRLLNVDLRLEYFEFEALLLFVLLLLFELRSIRFGIRLTNFFGCFSSWSHAEQTRFSTGLISVQAGHVHSAVCCVFLNIISIEE